MLMAEPGNHDVRDRPHVVIDAYRETAAYAVPGRKMERKPLRGDYAAHAASLLTQLGGALGELPLPAEDPRLRLHGLKAGTVVEIATLVPTSARATAAKVPTALDFAVQGHRRAED